MAIIRNKNGQFERGSQFWLGKKGIKKPNSGSFVKGLIPWNKGRRIVGFNLCKYCGKKFSTNKGNLTRPHQKYCSIKCKQMAQRGINYGKRLDKTIEYKDWRRAVFMRDNYKCVWCGSTEKLEADHIKPQSKFPELVFEISNGRTLCVGCHKKTDTYAVHL